MITEETKVIFMTLFYYSLLNTTPLKLSITFKLCEFNINRWKLCFVVVKKVPRPINVMVWSYKSRDLLCEKQQQKQVVTRSTT